MNARRGLDPEDLEENVSGVSGGNSVTGRRRHKWRTCRWSHMWRYCDEYRFAGLWFDRCG